MAEGPRTDTDRDRTDSERTATDADTTATTDHRRFDRDADDDDATETTRTVDEDRAPDDISDMPKSSFVGVLKRAFAEFQEDNVTDWAAALTYYGVLSIFPTLLALVSLLGLFGQSATQPLLDNLQTIAPGPAKDLLTQAIQNLQKSQGAAGVVFVVGLAVGDLVGVRVRRRVHARGERDLGRRGGPPGLEDAPDPPRRHRDPARPADRERDGRRRSPGRWPSASATSSASAAPR